MTDTDYPELIARTRRRTYGMVKPNEMDALADAVEALWAAREETERQYQEAVNRNLATLTERDDALRALGESRQRFADSETKRAELEAVIAEMGEATDIRHGSKLDRLDRVAMLSATSPSVVLQDRDREVAARAVEAVAHDLAEPRTLWWSNAYGPQVQTDDETGAKVTLDDWFAERAAAYRADQDGGQS